MGGHLKGRRLMAWWCIILKSHIILSVLGARILQQEVELKNVKESAWIEKREKIWYQAPKSGYWCPTYHETCRS